MSSHRIVKSLLVGTVAVLLAAVSACKTGSGREPSVSTQEVISWAHIDDTLRHRVDLIEVAQADGQAILGDYVILLNGYEVVNFVKEHGYRSFRGPVEVRKRGVLLEVDVEITGADGEKAIMMLAADGTMQGVG